MKDIGRSQGFSLIEVLIALLILGIGLLGVAGVQVFALQNTTSSDSRTQASLLANELGERVRVDLVNVSSYAQARTDSCPASGGLAEWCETLQRVLPDAEYSVEWSASDSLLDINLWWFERQMFGSDPDGEIVSHYQYQVRYPQ